MLRKSIGVLLVGLLGWHAGFAEDSIPPHLLSSVGKLIPGVEPDSVRRSPIPDLYEVVYAPHVIYVSADGRYLFRGDVLDMETQANLTEGKRKQARRDAVERLGEDSMVVFSPEQATHTVSVFTDIDCAYCQKLHREMADYNGRGIAIRYLAYPRAGIPSRSYTKAVSVWCADDKRKAMTDAKTGKDVPSKKCENPVRDHYLMGRMLGLGGTPTIITDSGEVLPGYVPADRLIKLLDASESGS